MYTDPDSLLLIDDNEECYGLLVVYLVLLLYCNVMYEALKHAFYFSVKNH